MKKKILVTLCLVFALAPMAAAGPNDDVKKTAEDFYAQYFKGYLNKKSKGDPEKALVRWVDASPYLTDGFKKALRKAVADARKDEPELGLDYDPIVNGQDFPDKGYRAKEVLVTGDKAAVTMEGIRQTDFTVSLSLVKTGDRWKIDSIGDMNAPR